MSKTAPNSIGVIARVIAALLGGYILASLSTIALTLALPIDRSEAALTGIMAGFVVYVGAVMWAFAASSAWRACTGLLAPTFVLAGTIMWLRLGGAA